MTNNLKLMKTRSSLSLSLPPFLSLSLPSSLSFPSFLSFLHASNRKGNSGQPDTFKQFVTNKIPNQKINNTSQMPIQYTHLYNIIKTEIIQQQYINECTYTVHVSVHNLYTHMSTIHVHVHVRFYLRRICNCRPSVSVPASLPAWHL